MFPLNEKSIQNAWEGLLRYVCGKEVCNRAELFSRKLEFSILDRYVLIEAKVICNLPADLLASCLNFSWRALFPAWRALCSWTKLESIFSSSSCKHITKLRVIIFPPFSLFFPRISIEIQDSKSKFEQVLQFRETEKIKTKFQPSLLSYSQIDSSAYSADIYNVQSTMAR